MQRAKEGVMGNSADRAAVLVQAIEATVAGDSRVVRDLYADDLQGWSPVMTVSSPPSALARSASTFWVSAI